LLTGSEHIAALDEISTAITDLSRQRHGAIIVLERSTGLEEIIESGVRIDAGLNAKLLEGIFFPNSPLHDKAVIVRGDRIVAASCTLPVAVGNPTLACATVLPLAWERTVPSRSSSQTSGLRATEGRLIRLRDGPTLASRPYSTTASRPACGVAQAT
jgi:hypothetical protein